MSALNTSNTVTVPPAVSDASFENPNATRNVRRWRRVPTPPAPTTNPEHVVGRSVGGNLSQLSALSAWQRRMERYPQLDAVAQGELHKQYRMGRAAAEELMLIERRGGRNMSSKTVRELQRQVVLGDKAMDGLVGANFRLVLLICRENAERRFGRDRALEIMGDLVGEANVALVEAITQFDPEKGPSFPTYAARVVRDLVRAEIDREGPVRLSPSWARLKRIAAVRIPQLATELGRTPSETEIKEALLERCMAWAEEKLTPEQRLLPLEEREAIKTFKLRKQGMLGGIEALPHLLMVSGTVGSLDVSVGDDNSMTVADFLVSGMVDPLEAVTQQQLSTELEAMLADLPERERTIIQLRFGFDNQKQWTYKMLGDKFGITAERVRQLERNVIRRLRSPSLARDRLAEFLPGLDHTKLEDPTFLQ